MSYIVEIHPYSTDWPDQFMDTAKRIRIHMKDLALRIDHIGSTSIPGLAAKPIIDIQISVLDFEPFEPILEAMKQAGFWHKSENPDISKRYFREIPPAKRLHIHIERAGSFGEQSRLLFRDYLRAHPSEINAYEQLKRKLAALYSRERAIYTESKSPFIWECLQKAQRWCQQTGWQAGKSDA